MPKKEVPLDSLARYLPDGTAAPVLDFLTTYKVHLTITRERKSVLGDYRHRTGFQNHRISVNGNLNKYSFLITLVHELAHLLTFEKYGNRVPAHGTEWKNIYSYLVKPFLDGNVFPLDIQKELSISMRNPAASSCAEDGLLRVLRNYDPGKNGHRLVEELAYSALFRTSDGRVFQKGEKLRKRFRCKEVATGKEYLFSPVYEVREVS